MQPLRHDAFKPKLTGGNMLVELETLAEPWSAAGGL
jgi:hypothetical protein